MRKRWVIGLLLLVGAVASAQEPLTLEQVLAANSAPTVKATWHQVRHTELLTENLESDGVLYLEQPDNLRWETLSPVHQLSVFSGESPKGRFRMPTEKDFRVSLLEGEEYTFILTPLRRDLKQLFSSVTLKVQRGSLQIQSALLSSVDGDWTFIEFRDIVKE